MSHRELEVLQALTTGMTNQEIAGALFISEKTVANHITHILSKTGASNRTEAAGYAHRHNLSER